MNFYEKRREILEKLEPRMKHESMPRSCWDGIYYHPLTPRADNEELANIGQRLIVYHGSATRPKTVIRFAPVGVLTAGWVIGIRMD